MRALRAVLRVGLVCYFISGIGYLALRHVVWPNSALWLPQVERLIEHRLGRAIELDELRAGFDGLLPSIEIDGFRIAGNADVPAFTARRVHAVLSPRSLLVGDLRFRLLEIDGASLRVDRVGARRIELAGMAVDLDQPGGSDGATWLLGQRRIVLRDVDLQWHDRLAQRSLLLEQGALEFGSVGRRHRIGLRVPQIDGLIEGLTLALEAWRPTFTGFGQWSQWKGEVFLEAERAELARLRGFIGELRPLVIGVERADASAGLLGQLEVDGGAAALRVWARFAQGMPQDGLVQLAGADFDLRWSGQHLPFAGGELEATLARAEEGHTAVTLRRYALRDDDGFELASVNDAPQALHIDSDGELIGGALSLQRFDAARLLAIVRALPLPSSLHERIAPLRVAGGFERVDLDWGSTVPSRIDALARYRIQARFDELSFDNSERAPPPGRLATPAFRRVSGEVRLDQDGGQLDLRGKGSTLIFPGLFEDPEIHLDALRARAHWRLLAQAADAPALEFELQGLEFASADATGTLSGSYRSGGKGLGSVDLNGRLEHADAAQVARYLPLVIDEPVRKWVREAVRAGRSEDVRLRLRGDLRDFPFRDPTLGEFRVEALVHDVELHYAPGWPAVNDAAARLVFERESMRVEDARGRSGKLMAGKAAAQIADFRKPVLQLQGQVDGLARDMTAFVQASPLRERVGAELARWNVEGDARLQLELDAPIKQLAQTTVAGQVELSGNSALLDPSLPRFENVAGSVWFTQRGPVKGSLKGRFLGGPIGVELARASTGGLEIRAQGEVSGEAMSSFAALPPVSTASADNPARARLTGETAWQARMTVDEGRSLLRIDSDLSGLSSLFPAPLTKAAAASWPLNVEVETRSVANPTGSRNGGQQLERIDLRLRSDLRASIERAGSAGVMRLRRGAIGFGAEPELPDSGIALRVNAPRLDLDAWRELLTAVSSSDAGARSGESAGSAAPAAMGIVPDDVSLVANSLRIAGRELNEVVVGATRREGFWRANVHAREIDGFFSWRAALPGQPIGTLRARFDRLEIPTSKAGEVESLLATEPSALPGLDIEARELVLGARRLGRLVLRAANTGTTGAPVWRLETLNIEHPSATLDARGTWSRRRAGEPLRTDLDLALTLHDSGALLDLFGFEKTMAGGVGRFGGQVAWTGSPLTIDYPTLAGQVELSLGRGSFLKVDPGAAKLIGVLNLQSLRRRLAFDFNDLFAEGFAFDEVKGTAQIERGTARTEDFRMRGITAKVSMRGSANLVHETQDLIVRVEPEVDAAIASLAYAALVNPAVGIGTLLAQLLLRKPLSEMLAWEYEIKGVWSDPQLQTRSRPKLPDAEASSGG